MLSGGSNTPCRPGQGVLLALALLTVLLQFAPLQGARADESLRTEAGRILESREFRNFPRLDRRDPLADQPELDNCLHGGSAGEAGEGGRPGAESSSPAGSQDRLDSEAAPDSGQASSGRSAESGRSTVRPRIGSGAVSGIAALAGPIVTFTSWLVIAAVVILLTGLVVQAVRDRIPGSGKVTAATTLPEPADSAVPAVAPGQTDPERLLQLAGELAAQGHHKEALHQVVLAAMSSTERAGLVRFRRGLTLHDYLRALSTRSPAGWNSLKQMAQVFEPVFYGNCPASREMVELVLEDYITGFQTIEAPRQN